MRVPKRRIWVPCLTLMMLMVVTVVSGAKTKCTGYEELPTKKFINYNNATNIKLLLESSPRVTHQLLSHAFKIVLEELHGYANVEIVTRNDDFNITKIIGGYLDDNGVCRVNPSAMMNLEAWVPSSYDLAEDLIPMCFVDGGALRKPGFFGWFVPRDLLPSIRRTYRTNNGKATIVVDDDDIPYGAFRNRTFAAYFDITDRALSLLRDRIDANRFKQCGNMTKCDKVIFIPERCRDGNACAWLLAPDYASTRFVVAHIERLQLYVKVAWLDADLRRFVDAVKSFYRRDAIAKSALILSWYPSDVIADVQAYVRVTFQMCRFVDASAQDDGDDDDDVGCEYEIRRVVKLAWNQLPRIAPPVYQMLQRTTLNETDYKTMLAIYRAQPATATYRETACKWLRNSTTWMNWTSRGPVDEIFIGGIFPYTTDNSMVNPITYAAHMAVQAINRNRTILPYYTVKLKVKNGNCSIDTVLTSFIDYIKWSRFEHLAGVLGPACTETVDPLAAVSKQYNNLIVSYSAEGADYSDREKYPYVFRTIGENIQFKYVYLALFKQLDWHRVAAFTKDGQKYTEYITHLETLLAENNITFIVNAKFPEDRDQNLIPRYLEDLKSKRARIIIADTFDHDARVIMCSAYKLGMTARQGYVWFLPHWLDENWYNTDEKINEHVNCTTKEMFEAINGYFIVTNAYFASNESIMQENKTVKEWRESYKVARSSLSNYGGYVYDAVWTYAYALDKVLREYPEVYSNFHTLDATRKLVRAINETSFRGVSGDIDFYGSASRRHSIVDVMQFYNGTIYTIGKYYPNRTQPNGPTRRADHVAHHGRLVLNESDIVWLTETGEKPDDGTLPSSCAIEWFANFLGVECYLAVVCSIIVCFTLITIGLSFGTFLLMRKRYKKKEELIAYMKSLGIDLAKGYKFADLDKWEVRREFIILNRKIGEGAFGKVYGGEANIGGKGWVAVAVKSLKVGSTNEEQLDFLSEAEIMKRFDHKNIIKLLGVCTKNEPVLVVMEFMLYGDLKTFLLARRNLVHSKNVEVSEEISSKKLTSMALDVARGLSYLAERRYVHRDLASRNCLVNANRVVKIGDFGMTRPMFDNDYYKFHRKGKLPVRWMAPESLWMGVFTPSSDVWSYGVLLYEIVTFGSFPFQGMSNNEVLEHVKAGNTLTVPQGVKPQLEALLKSCWCKEREMRPKATEIVEFIANNPRLIAPCLDVPLSSVQIDDTAETEIVTDSGSPLTGHTLRSFSFSNGGNHHQQHVHSTEFGQPDFVVDDATLQRNNCIQLMVTACDDDVVKCAKSRRTSDTCEQQKLLESSVPNGHAMTMF